MVADTRHVRSARQTPAAHVIVATEIRIMFSAGRFQNYCVGMINTLVPPKLYGLVSHSCACR